MDAGKEAGPLTDEDATPIERGLLYRLKRAWEAGVFRNLPPPTQEQLRLCNVRQMAPPLTGQKVIETMLDLWRKIGR